jgi:hypothetical protein
MKTLKMGILKEVYQGEQIYWNGSYIAFGEQFDKIGEVKNRINQVVHLRMLSDLRIKKDAILGGAIRVDRTEDGVILHLPSGLTPLSFDCFRKQIFSIEEKHGEVVILSKWEVENFSANS